MSTGMGCSQNARSLQRQTEEDRKPEAAALRGRDPHPDPSRAPAAGEWPAGALSGGKHLAHFESQ